MQSWLRCCPLTSGTPCRTARGGVRDAKKCGGEKTNWDGDGSCAVCLAEFRDGETLRLLPRCGHMFHRDCIDTWLRVQGNCPLRRAPPSVGVQTEETERGGMPDHAVRRAASMVALTRRAWPDVSLRAPRTQRLAAADALQPGCRAPRLPCRLTCTELEYQKQSRWTARGYVVPLVCLCSSSSSASGTSSSSAGS